MGKANTITKAYMSYKVHLIVPSEIEDFSKFSTDFGKAMQFIAKSEDKNALWKMREDEEYKRVDAETVQLINVCRKGNLIKKKTNVEQPIFVEICYNFRNNRDIDNGRFSDDYQTVY